MSAEITRELLQAAPVEGMPGWETRLFLITYPADADGSGHSHPVSGIRYALEGMMVSAFDDDADEVIIAGQSFQTHGELSSREPQRQRDRADAVCDRIHGEDGRAQYHVAFKVAGKIPDSFS
jgi:hypothetical protein